VHARIVKPSPHAIFHAMFWRKASAAWRSESPSSSCNSIAEQITSPGIEGRPKSDGNNSANSSSGNNSWR
jgi:hypothetical protein